MLAKDTVVSFEEHLGIINNCVDKCGTHYYVQVRDVNFKVPTEKLTVLEKIAYYNSYTQFELMRPGHNISTRNYSLLSLKSKLKRCMERPYAFTTDSRFQYYFGGWARIEILDFIEEFNNTYTFAIIEVTAIEKYDIAYIYRQGWCYMPFMGPGDKWCFFKVCINLKYANKYVAKLLCVLLRTYFYTERYDRLDLGNHLSGNTPIKTLFGILNYNLSTYHYFFNAKRMLVVLKTLEKFDYSLLVSKLYSQSRIYEDILIGETDGRFPC